MALARYHQGARTLMSLSSHLGSPLGNSPQCGIKYSSKLLVSPYVQNLQNAKQNSSLALFQTQHFIPKPYVSSRLRQRSCSYTYRPISIANRRLSAGQTDRYTHRLTIRFIRPASTPEIIFRFSSVKRDGLNDAIMCRRR